MLNFIDMYIQQQPQLQARAKDQRQEDDTTQQTITSTHHHHNPNRLEEEAAMMFMALNKLLPCHNQLF
ncbi:hypothetical protein MJO29_002368 [Puccinia striiformis f. sp. tritici]|nr:hypothetical protein MJO29_002368 [Puccinia striiformis f. sp. tritici]